MCEKIQFSLEHFVSVCLNRLKNLHFIHTKSNNYEDNYNSNDNYNVYYY